MNTPYDNGKVKIGIYYKPPVYVEQDPDMIAIQGWFLGINNFAKRERYAKMAYLAFLVIAVVLGVIYG